MVVNKERLAEIFKEYGCMLTITPRVSTLKDIAAKVEREQFGIFVSNYKEFIPHVMLYLTEVEAYEYCQDILDNVNRYKDPPNTKLKPC